MKFEMPIAEIIALEVADIITTSGNDDSLLWGDNEDTNPEVIA